MPGLTFHLLPHTHWDREWYLPRAVFGARLVTALDDLIDRLERTPPFRSFLLDGQTVLLEDYLRIRPEQRPRVEALARERRLQIGPWYVLADELVPSAESLIRNLLLGRRDAQTLGGGARVLWSPDAFGHPAAWPTLAAEFGLPYGVLWRGLGGEPGQHGDLYCWAGPDGREVLVHHLPPDGYEAGSGLVGTDEAIGAAWALLRPVLVDRAATSQVAVPLGADHHAAHAAMDRLVAALSRLEKGHTVRVSRWDEYFDAAAAEAGGTLPSLNGELRWSYAYTWTLQGVHATRAPLKRRHAEAELWLERFTEPLAALASIARAIDVRPVLRDTWRTLVRSQFHDSIGGCTSDPVARRVRARLEDAESVARELGRTCLDALLRNDPDLAREQPSTTAPRLVLWNPVPRPRAGTVVIADVTWFQRDVLVGPPSGRGPRTGPPPQVFDLGGEHGTCAVQPLGAYNAHERMDAMRHYPDQDEVDVRRVAFRVPPLGGFGLGTLAPLGAGAEPDGAVSAGARRLDNGLVAVQIADDGGLTLEHHATGARYRELLRLESSGDVGDTYTYCPPSADRVVRLTGPVVVRALAPGPLVGALEVRGALTLESGPVAMRTVLALHDGSPALRVTLEIDNGATDHRLRLRCPTGLAGGEAVAGAPFGTVRRPPVAADASRYPREHPVVTAPAQRFVARASGARGLAVLAPGFFEYEHTAAGDLVVTLLRCVGELSRSDLPSRSGHAGWPIATPDAQCLGRERLQLALAPVTEAQVEDGAVLPELWEDCFLPPQARWLRAATPLEPERIDVRLEGRGLVFGALKPAEEGDGVLLRCWNARADRAVGAWRFDRRVARAWRVHADESLDRAEPLQIDGDRRRLALEVAPYAVATVRVELEAPARRD